MNRRLILLLLALALWGGGARTDAPCDPSPRRVAPYPTWAQPAEARVTVVAAAPVWIPNVLGHWRLDEGSGLTAATTRGSYALTAAGSSGWSWTTRIGGGAAVAMSGAASQPLNAALWSAVDKSHITICAWLKASASGSTVAVSLRSAATKGAYFGLYQGKYWAYFSAGADAYGNVTAATPTAWHHVCTQYDGSGTGNSGRAALWVDGAAQTLSYFGTIPAAITDSGTPPLRLGKDVPVGESTGEIDDVWLISGNLTAAQRAAIMAGTAQ